MAFKLLFTLEAESQLKALEEDGGLAKRLKAARRALGHLETNPRHQSLGTHKYDAMAGLNGEEIFEAYAENKTPAAYRIFFFYGPDENVTEGKTVTRVPVITVVAITPHPK